MNIWWNNSDFFHSHCIQSFTLRLSDYERVIPEVCFGWNLAHTGISHMLCETNGDNDYIQIWSKNINVRENRKK